MKFAGLVIALISCCHLAVAQQTDKVSTPTAQRSEESLKQNTKSLPSAELQSLSKALSGSWSLNVKFEPDPKMPNGFASNGEETWRSGPGGYTLLEEEHLRMREGELFLLGIVWWNAANQSFHGMECQNLLPYTCDVKGAQKDITMSWDGNQFVIDEIETSTSG